MLILNKKITKLGGFFVFILSIFSFFIVFQNVYAQACVPTEQNYQCYGIGEKANVPEGLRYNEDIPTTAGKVIGAGLSFIGVLFFILMLYGGIIWMTAQGNEQQVSKAKDLITAAIIGIIIVLSAYAITAFIGTELTTPSAN